ncbi:MAG: hypothetical protein R6U57_05490 [Anaerolineales bacterium]
MSIPSSSMPRTTKKLAVRRLAEIDRELERGETTEGEVAQEQEMLKQMAGREWRLKLWFLLGLLFATAVGTAILRAIAIWVGLLVGLEVAVLGDFGMLRAIGVPAPRLLDMLATGLVIGAGPGPMHAVIGMLQGGKKVLDNLAALAEGRAARETVQDLRKVTAEEP